MKFKKGETVLVEGEVVEGRGWDLYDVSFGDAEDDTLTVGPKGIYPLAEFENTYDYNKGVNDAWELARKIVLPESDGGYSSREMHEIFGNEYADTRVFKALKFEGVKKLVDEWEKSIFNVGDLVRILGSSKKGVVTGVKGDTCHILWSNGICERADRSALTKIGKLDGTQEFLDRIEEGDDA